MSCFWLFQPLAVCVRMFQHSLCPGAWPSLLPAAWERHLGSPSPQLLPRPAPPAPRQGSSQPISTPGSDPQSLLSGLTGRPSVPSAGLPPNKGIRSRKTWPPACSPGGCLGCGHEPHHAGAGAGGEGSPASGSARPGRETSAALRGLLGLSCGRVQRQKGSSQAAAPKLLTAGPGGSRRPTYDFFLQVSLSSAPAVVSEPLRAFQTRLLRRDPPNPGHTPVTHAALPPRDPPPFHRHPRGCLRAPLPSSSLSAQSSLPSLAQINAKVSLQAWALSGPPLPPRRPQGYSHRGLRLCGRPPCPARARGGPQCGWVHPGTEEAPSAAPSPLS